MQTIVGAILLLLTLLRFNINIHALSKLHMSHHHHHRCHLVWLSALSAWQPATTSLAATATGPCNHRNHNHRRLYHIGRRPLHHRPSPPPSRTLFTVQKERRIVQNDLLFVPENHIAAKRAESGNQSFRASALLIENALERQIFGQCWGFLWVVLCLKV